MNLVEVLKNKIESLEEGDYTPGLQAVLLHIETAFRHLSRGQDCEDDTAFTDAIYRTNQAFEGSIKEAYRVLASQDPARQRPYDIENYLERNNIFRPRVLKQLTNYRTEWRNPSAHDYKLDFDDSEAFLAIISVSAFACLLLDQITERLAFISSQAEIEAQKSTLKGSTSQRDNSDLLEHVTELLNQFCAWYLPTQTDHHWGREERFIIGALHAFLSSLAPQLTVQTEALLGNDRHRADLLVGRGDSQVIVEVKRKFVHARSSAAIAQVENYLLSSGIKNAVLLFLPNSPTDMEQLELKVSAIDGRLMVLQPKQQGRPAQSAVS